MSAAAAGMLRYRLLIKSEITNMNNINLPLELVNIIINYVPVNLDYVCEYNIQFDLIQSFYIEPFMSVLGQPVLGQPHRKITRLINQLIKHQYCTLACNKKVKMLEPLPYALEDTLRTDYFHFIVSHPILRLKLRHNLNLDNIFALYIYNILVQTNSQICHDTEQNEYCIYNNESTHCLHLIFKP